MRLVSVPREKHHGDADAKRQRLLRWQPRDGYHIVGLREFPQKLGRKNTVRLLLLVSSPNLPRRSGLLLSSFLLMPSMAVLHGSESLCLIPADCGNQANRDRHSNSKL